MPNFAIQNTGFFWLTSVLAKGLLRHHSNKRLGHLIAWGENKMGLATRQGGYHHPNQSPRLRLCAHAFPVDVLANKIDAFPHPGPRDVSALWLAYRAGSAYTIVLT